MEAFYLLNRAQNWQEFSDALALFDVPSQNFVYADKEGNIGYYLSGKIPLRSAAAALYPFPGWKEEGQWKGYLDEDKKPNLFNPEEGFIITANNKIISDDFPYYISFDWDAPFRAERIRELLSQREKHTIESFREIQNDVYTKKGEQMLIQLHHQFKDRTEMQAQQDIDENNYFDEMRAFVKEIKESHPLPKGAIWMACNEKSKDFVGTNV